jgi:hypothetical protein
MRSYKMSKLIHVTIALYLKEDADIGEVVAEMDYDFEYKDQIRNMELVDYTYELQCNNS